MQLLFSFENSQDNFILEIDVLQLLPDCKYRVHKNTFDTDLLAEQHETLAEKRARKSFIFLYVARKSLGSGKSALESIHAEQFITLVRDNGM